AFLHARVARIDCPDCGLRLINVPWARPGSGFTPLFEAFVMALVKGMPVAAAARRVREHDTRLWRGVQPSPPRTVPPGCGRADPKIAHAGAWPSGTRTGAVSAPAQSASTLATPAAISAEASIVSWRSREAAGFPIYWFA